MKPQLRADQDPSAVNDHADDSQKNSSSALTLKKGLDVLDRVSKGDSTLGEIGRSLGVNKTTVHRLASTLVEMDFLSYSPRDGYCLGSRLLELGFVASHQITLTRIAHPHLMRLSADTGDTVSLGIRDGHDVHYIDKIAGTRRIEVRCIVGERQALRNTALGKALLLDESEETWRDVYRREAAVMPDYRYELKTWLGVMADYRASGCALDLDENEDHIRCVAAPIRGIRGRIIAAISVSSAKQYMDDERIKTLEVYVRETAKSISRGMGFKSMSGQS